MEQNSDNTQGIAGKGVLMVIDNEPPVGDNTTLMLHMAGMAALRRKTPAAYFSPGMTNTEVVNRLIAVSTGIDHKDIEAGVLTDEEWKKVDAALPALIGTPLYIDDTPKISLNALDGRIRAVVKDHGVRLVVVDRTDLVSPSGLLTDGQLREAVTSRLKQLAGELGITIIAVEK